ncbi:DinB family protein [Nocardioides agariphilus]|jgi:hypothetical protein|uniref:DinB family protein n=2 Tax=Nocardioides agariphilus TaxID=433664 RepID=A0A930VPK7_9ACTN|nr:DinB family protein [Nocardioides agariphilus]MBF4768367.1 DinB family protein [Nocardioides agariphilus]
MLRSFLDYYRATILRQTEGLTAEQLATPLPPATMTLGGILKHLSWVENWWWVQVLQDGPELDWVGDGFADDPDWEWHSAKDDDWQLLVSRYQASIAVADEALDRVLASPEGLDTLARRARHGRHASVRWILVHLIEEYARHAGHADLIREAVDGATDL